MPTILHSLNMTLILVPTNFSLIHSVELPRLQNKIALLLMILCFCWAIVFDYLLFEESISCGVSNKNLILFQNQDLRMNLLDYQNIIDKQALQRDAVGGEHDMQAKLTERNKQVADLLGQITVCYD